MRRQALPLRGDAAALVVRIILPQAGNQHGVDLAIGGRGEFNSGNVRHSDGLHHGEIVQAAPGANLLGRQPEEVAEGAGECLVGAIPGLERDGQDVRCAVGQSACRLAEAAGSQIAEHGMAGYLREQPAEVEARQSAHLGDLAEGQRVGRMAFYVPERFFDGVHVDFPRSATTMAGVRLPRLIAIAIIRNTGRRQIDVMAFARNDLWRRNENWPIEGGKS